jgi:LemA protein
MAHEKSVLQELTELRTKANNPNLSNQEVIDIDKQVTSALGTIMVSVENYPELKSNENILQLQDTLTEVESQISAARRAYNQSVTDYNNALEMIPTNFIASALNYKPKNLFEITQEERRPVSMEKLFQD